MVTCAARGTFDHMQVGQLQGPELASQMLEQRLGVGVRCVIGRSDRRQPHTHPGTADFLDYRQHHLHEQAGAVLYRAAVSVCPVVRACAQELVEQITVGAMHLDAVEPGLDGAPGGMPVVGHDAGHFVEPQGARHRGGDEGRYAVVQQQGFGVGGDGRWRHRGLAAGLQVVVRHTSHMPELDHDLATGGMDCVRDVFPGGHLCVVPDARDVDIALALVADRRGLGDDQPGAGALRVVGAHQGVGQSPGCTVAGQRGHHDAVGEVQASGLDGVEQSGHVTLGALI